MTRWLPVLGLLLLIPAVAWAQTTDGSFITWDTLKTFSGQVAAVAGLTAFVFRGIRGFWPETPEAVIQFIAVILSVSVALVTSKTQGIDVVQWVVLGIFNGVLTGQIVIKSLDWAVAAKTGTGVPESLNAKMRRDQAKP